MLATILATVVTQSGNAAQVFALIAIILFLVLAIWRFVQHDVVIGFVCVGLAFIAASLLWLA